MSYFTAANSQPGARPVLIAALGDRHTCAGYAAQVASPHVLRPHVLRLKGIRLVRASPAFYAEMEHRWFLSKIAVFRNGCAGKRNYQEKTFPKKANVSYGSLKRFEETGNISLTSLLKLAIALECTAEFETLFKSNKPDSIEEIINVNY